MCQRCGCVGFHSEACIAAASAERIAAQGVATLHDCSMAVEARLVELRAAVEGLPAWKKRPFGAAYVNRRAVLALLDAGKSS